MRPKSTQRPARGTAEETRARLVVAAAKLFERHGFHGTDSNRIAEAAGYAAGTFYKHFDDKEAIFLAAYDAWLADEWRAIEGALASAPPDDHAHVACTIVDVVLARHRRARGLRASLRALAVTSARVRSARRRALSAQLDRAADIRARLGRAPHPREASLLMLLAIERTCDAIADGEAADVGADPGVLAARLRDDLARHLR